MAFGLLGRRPKFGLWVGILIMSYFPPPLAPFGGRGGNKLKSDGDVAVQPHHHQISVRLPAHMGAGLGWGVKCDFAMVVSLINYSYVLKMNLDKTLKKTNS